MLNTKNKILTIPEGIVTVAHDNRIEEPIKPVTPAAVTAIYRLNTEGWFAAQEIRAVIDQYIEECELSDLDNPVKVTNKEGDKVDDGTYLTMRLIDHAHLFRYVGCDNQVWRNDVCDAEDIGGLLYREPAELIINRPVPLDNEIVLVVKDIRLTDNTLYDAQYLEVPSLEVNPDDWKVAYNFHVKETGFEEGRARYARVNC